MNQGGFRLLTLPLELMATIGIQALWATLPIAGGAAWFVWQRFQNLESRLRGDEERLTQLRHEMEERLTKLSHRLEMNRQAVQSNYDQIQYLVHANKELIDHRTDRFNSSLAATEKRLAAEIAEVKGFLAKTSGFMIRNPGEE